jgi:hypothetical protein
MESPMKRSREISTRWALLLLMVTVVLVLLAGWHREMASRYPVSDLPFIDQHRLSEQVRSGNVGKTEAIYYRKKYAGADTTEIR